MAKFIYTIIGGILLVAVATTVLAIFPNNDGLLGLDVIFHLMGGAFVAWCGYLLNRRLTIIWLVVAIMSVGWELAEYLSLVFGPTYWPAAVPYYYSGGLVDSLADLVVDGFGALVFILLYCRYDQNQSN